MKKVITKSFLVLGVSLFLSSPLLVSADQISSGDIQNESVVNFDEMTDVETYVLTNAQLFANAEKYGINVKEILGEQEYQKALRQDMFRTGSSWVTKYKYKNETRISIGVNSAFVKTYKYGGQAGIYAVQALGVAVGLPLDAMVSTGMHAQLSTINSSRGYKWTIGTSPWRIISSGYQ